MGLVLSGPKRSITQVPARSGTTAPSAGTMATGASRVPKSSVTTVSMPLNALRMVTIAAVTEAMTNMEIPEIRCVKLRFLRVHA